MRFNSISTGSLRGLCPGGLYTKVQACFVNLFCSITLRPQKYMAFVVATNSVKNEVL